MAYIHTSTLTDTSTVTFDERDGSESGSGGPVFVNFSLSEAITDDYTSIKVTPDEPNEDIDIYIYRTDENGARFSIQGQDTSEVNGVVASWNSPVTGLTSAALMTAGSNAGQTKLNNGGKQGVASATWTPNIEEFKLKNLLQQPGSNASGTTVSGHYVAIIHSFASNKLPAFTFKLQIGPPAPDKPVMNAITTPSNNTQPTVTGTGTNGDTIKVFADGTNVGTTTVAANDSWSVQTSVLTEGDHVMTATATNQAGTESVASDAQTIKIDTTAPTITSFTIDKASGSYKVGEAFQITANTSENIVNGNTITVTLNTGGDGTDVVLTAPADGTTLTGTYTVAAGNTSSSLTVSSFTIGTVADTAGNAMTSTTLPAAIFDGKTIVIDTTAPSNSSLTLTKTDGNVLGATNNVKIVKLTVTSQDEVLNVSDAASFKTNMIVYKNAVEVVDKTNISVSNYSQSETGPYVYSAEVDLTNEGDAAYTFAFAAIDLAGNNVQLDAVSYTLDSTAPTLTTVGLSSNNGNSALAKAGNEITLTMVASENINQPTVSMQIGSTTVTPTIAGADKNWTAKYTVQAGNNGLVSFGIDFSDTTTNAGTTVTTVTNGSSVTVDTVAPVLAQVTAVPTPSNDQTPSFVFTTTKAGTLSSSLGFSTGAAVATGSNQTVTFNTLAGGTYTGETITVTDTYGNSGSFTIPDFVIDTTAPTLTTVGLSSNNGNAAYAKAGNEITLTMVASENINEPTVTMSINGTAVTPTIAGADKNWTAKYTAQAGQNGAVTFTINFSDTNSNTGTEVTTVTNGSSVTVDTVAPVLAQVTAVPTPSNDQTPSFVFTTTKAGTLTTI